ncbi:MAG: hypothetical protein LBF36_01505 [Mycoplasmataceae bacterium]|nr:hypothetical protein [Mycoplasmataceae bacterium]
MYRKLTKYLSPLIFISVGIVPTVTSCSNKTETQIMIDLFSNRCYFKSNIPINEPGNYYKLWTDLANNNSSSYGVPEIDRCLEYSLYLPYLYTKGVALIKTNNLTIKLKSTDSLWNFYTENTLQLQFLTAISDVEYQKDDNSLLLTYTGYLRLKMNSQIILEKTDNITDDDYSLDSGSVIEILFSFTNCLLTENNVKTPLDEGWWTQTINLHSFIGQIGQVSFYNSNQDIIANSGFNNIEPITNAANYFGAYYQ